MRFAIYPFSLGCEGAQALRDYLKSKDQHALLVKREGTFSPKEGDFIIGWGCSKEPMWSGLAENAWKWVNKFPNIHLAVNKLHSFDAMRNFGVSIPDHTKVTIIVTKWLTEGHTVLARERVAGKQGEGIQILSAGDPIPEAKFYSKVEPSTSEYRAYVLGGKLIDVLQKRRANGTDDPGIVRTEANGWVFCRQNVSIPAKCIQESVKALDSLGLQFGGVDVLWNAETTKATVLEVNTAPGIFGTGISKVGDALIAYRKGNW
jgi:glutathione synthase/RimK-type ligase-like ATP-grasp enzyme